IKKDQEAPVSQPQPARTMLIDKATGEVREVDSRQPIVIIQSPPAQVQAPAAQPIMLQDRDGKPITMDLTQMLMFNKAQAEERRAEEKHKQSMEMSSTIKDFMQGIANAAGRMGGNG
ncbi:MAG: hypothetical protein PHF31_11920, partial [Methylobacter sp.]|nr:hypothetical protein [Methylobacter sp.]